MQIKYLVADDTDELRACIAKYMKINGVHVVEVSDGYSLVEYARLGGYSLIVTDNLMPGITGLEAVTNIREFDGKTPIYVASDSCTEEEAEKAGATGYINKMADDYLKQIREIAQVEYIKANQRSWETRYFTHSI